MSFMYKTMMSRAPNKRKIKLNEANILRLISNSADEEDDEDEDFTLAKIKAKEQEKDTKNEGDSDEMEITDTTDSDDSSESNSTDSDAEELIETRRSAATPAPSRCRKTSRHKKVVNNPTVGETDALVTSRLSGMSSSNMEILLQATRQLKQSENAVKKMKSFDSVICIVCLKGAQLADQSKLFTCSMCGIAVHEDCYNMSNLDFKVDSNDIWICDMCVHGDTTVTCEFCPNSWGCMKETKCGRWCHIVCARSILADYFFKTSSFSPKRSSVGSNTIYIALDCDSKQFGSKECILCEDRLVSKTGICIRCDAGFCKSTMHVTCAQRHGLLAQAGALGDPHGVSESFYANCPLHCEKEEMKERQKKFLLALKTADLKRQSLESIPLAEQRKVDSVFLRLQREKQRRYDLFLPPAPLPEQLPRLLSSDANFTRLLNQKAEKMFGISTQHPATIIPKPTEIRKKYYVMPSLTTDFAAYYADRLLRIDEEKSSLASAIQTNQDLASQQEVARQKYNEVRSKLIKLKHEHMDMKNGYETLKRGFTSIHNWIFNASPNIVGSKRRKRRKVTPKLTGKLFQDSSDEEGSSRSSMADILPDAESIIEWKSCGICKRQDNQHLLVKCDVCLEWQHLACLDPPLTQMPKRTKFSLWQCSECAESSDSSSSDNDSEMRGSFLNQDGRRLTRRLQRATEKMSQTQETTPQTPEKKQNFSESVFEDDSITEKRPNDKTNAKKGERKPPQPPKSSTSDPLLSRTDPKKDFPVEEACDGHIDVIKGAPLLTTSQPMLFPKTQRNIIILRKPITITKRPTILGKSRGLPAANQNHAESGTPTSLSPKVSKPEPAKSPPSEMRMKAKDNNLDQRPTKPSLVGSESSRTHICSVCLKSDNQKKIVTCDTCKKSYHWGCSDPPLKGNPKRLRFVLWECSECVENRESEEDDDNTEVKEDEKGCSVSPEGRRRISRKRKPPDVFEPDFTISGQQRIFKSLERKKNRIMAAGVKRESVTAARCRPRTASAPKLPSIKLPGNLPVSILTPLSGVAVHNLAGFKSISILTKIPSRSGHSFNITTAGTSPGLKPIVQPSAPFVVEKEKPEK